MTLRTWGPACAYAGAAALAIATPAFAGEEPDKAVTFSGEIAIDAIGAIRGGSDQRLHELDTASLTAEIDLEKLWGWTGFTSAFTVLHTSKSAPNDDVGALQGINNNEVGAEGTRLFEAWVQKDFERASVRLGVQDLNGEFHVTDAAGLLLAPQSGLASELAATGPSGPSTYPAAGLAARVRFNPTEDTYLQAAVYNAHVGGLGDAGGINHSFDLGAIQIVEAGWTGDGKIAVGAWRYSGKQDDLFFVDLMGDPLRRTAAGYYVTAERRVIDGGDGGRSLTAFLRAGVSDGRTGPFESSWQTGLLIAHVLPSRPDSAISIGYDQASLGDSFRRASQAAGQPLGSTESHFEITYFDRVNEHLSIQPDLQLVINPGGVRNARTAWVAMVRAVLGF